MHYDGCSLRRLQELTGADRCGPQGRTQATKESERANSLSKRKQKEMRNMWIRAQCW
jgi:hypothetical protein